MKKKCIFVVGPTASGKSAWALQQAEKYQGSIINIDSVQLYKGLVIGSAAPSVAEKGRANHYLYQYVEAPREMTAGDYLKDFYALLDSQTLDGKILDSSIKFPLFIVGGTGFYIQALEKGMFNIEPVPIEFRKIIEDELAISGAAPLYAELQEKDPDTKIHINDHYRLVRAIEIIRYTGLAPSQLRMNRAVNKNEFPYEHIKIGFDFSKNEFVERVKLRTQKIIDDGIIEETKKFYDLNLTQWAPLQSVGYKETVEFLRHQKSKEWLFEAIKLSTMQLIKKQKTWFKRDGAILWSKQEQALAQFLT